MNVIKRIWRGLQWSEKYGNHPGTFPVVMMIGFGILAGGLRGALIMSACFLPMYLFGAWARGA